MNIGIIIHSATGNTLLVAQKLKDNLIAKGHTVNIERVTALDDNPRAKGGSQLKDAPNVSSYDMLIFGAPVWAFSLSAVMKEYLLQIASLNKKRTGCFVTQHFSHAWMGGSHAIGQMKKLCKNKGAAVSKTGVINWSNKAREDQIKKLIDKFENL